MAGRKNSISDKEILQFFADSDEMFLSTTEVADGFEFSNSGILKRLKPLKEDGYLDSKSAGKSKTWWLTDDGREFLSDEDD